MSLTRIEDDRDFGRVKWQVVFVQLIVQCVVKSVVVLVLKIPFWNRNHFMVCYTACVVCVQNV